MFLPDNPVLKTVEKEINGFVEEAKGLIQAIGGFFPRIFVMTHRVSSIELEEIEDIKPTMDSFAKDPKTQAIALVFNVLTNSYDRNEDVPEEIPTTGDRTIGIWIYTPEKEWCRQVIFQDRGERGFLFNDTGWEESEYSTEYLSNPFKDPCPSK